MTLTHDTDLTQTIIGLAMRVHTRLSHCKVGLLLNFFTVSLKDGIRRKAL